MKLTQVKGNTYALEGRELIPLYKTDDTHCILLDTGLWHERALLEEALEEYNLTPVGIINSHIHPDHSANDRFFQEKYHLPVALPAGEAELCADMASIREYFHLNPDERGPGFLKELILHPELEIGHEDGPLEFLGSTFGIVHTPGHSPDHISIITPDGVCYAGDALLSGKMLGAKIPLNHSHQAALDSYTRLPHVDCDRYILAHYGVYEDVTELAAANQELILDRADRILSLITRPMCEAEIAGAALEHFSIVDPDRTKLLMIGHNVHSYLPYLIDRGDLEEVVRPDAVCYQRTAHRS